MLPPFHLSIFNPIKGQAFDCMCVLPPPIFFNVQHTGRLVRSDLANYSDNFLFIISHSRKPPWTIKPVNL